MNWFWTKILWTWITWTWSSEVINLAEYWKAQLFINAVSWTAWTFKVQFSPNNVDWYTPNNASFTLVWSETWDALKTLYFVWTCVPYLRVAWSTLSAWSISVSVCFNGSN